MALVIKASYAHMDASSAQFAPQVSDGLEAGEDLDVVAPCYIKGSDNKVYMSNGTAANEAANIVGFTPRAVRAGQPVTLFGVGTKFEYATGMTPGTKLYLHTVAGQLNTAPTTGDAVGVVQVLTSRVIRVIRMS